MQLLMFYNITRDVTIAFYTLKKCGSLVKFAETTL